MQNKFSQIILALIFWQLTVLLIFFPGLYFLLVCKSGALALAYRAWKWERGSVKTWQFFESSLLHIDSSLQMPTCMTAAQGDSNANHGSSCAITEFCHNWLRILRITFTMNILCICDRESLIQFRKGLST